MDIMDIIALFFLGVFLYGVFYVTWKKKEEPILWKIGSLAFLSINLIVVLLFEAPDQFYLLARKYRYYYIAWKYGAMGMFLVGVKAGFNLTHLAG